MRIGIMGGTFDPVHIGHLIAAESARVGMQLDEVWFMPTYIPPHKQTAPLAGAEHRLRMAALAVEDNPYFRVTDIEMQLGGVSYSVETVERLTGLYPEHRFYYIIGADMVQYLPKWYRIERLVELIDFVGLVRPGYLLDTEALDERVREKLSMVPMPLIDISSSTLRARLLAKQSVRYLLPDSVYVYVKENALYES